MTPKHVYTEFPPILSTNQVAAMCSLNPMWFFLARKNGGGPPYMQVSPRVVRYDRDVVLAWWRSHTKA